MSLSETLRRHAAADVDEAADLERIRAFVDRHANPFDRRLRDAHLTGSAFIVSSDGESALLLHHRKLERWLQPGGHAEEDEPHGEQVALREACEETAIAGLSLHPSAPRPLDVDVHAIPAREGEPAHEHLDLRYLVLAPPDARFQRSAAEATDMRWFTWAEIERLPLDHGLRRLARKARALVVNTRRPK